MAYQNTMLKFSQLKIYTTINNFPLNQKTRLMNNETIMKFHSPLQQGTLDSVIKIMILIVT